MMQELETVPNGRVTLIPEHFATVIVKRDGQIVHSSERTELRSLSLPTMQFDYLPGKYRVELLVETPSMDGLSSTIARYNLSWLPNLQRRENDVPWAVFQPEKVLIDLLDGKPSMQIAGDVTGRLLPRVVHALRVRGNMARIGLDWMGQKRSRVRPATASRNGEDVFDVEYNYIRQVGASVDTDISGTIPVVWWKRSSTPTNTPNFRTLKKWQYPVNPYVMEQVSYSPRMGYQRVQSLEQNPVTSLAWAGPIEFFQSVPAPDFVPNPVANSKAFKNLLKEIGREDFNVAVDLVQYRQVTRMVAKHAATLVSAYKDVKRGNLFGASSTLFGHRPPKYRRNGGPSARKSAASNWLELQYGWKPLLSDIGDLINELHSSYHPEYRVVRASGSQFDSTETPIMAPFHVSLASVNPFRAGMRVKGKRTKVTYGLRYSVSDADKVFLAQTGFTSPVNLAWELLPFSFVVDWFYPIGPYLERLTAFEGLSFVGGYKTTFIREETGMLVNTDGTHGVSPQTVSIKARMGSQRQAVKMVREVLHTFPDVPSIPLKNPISVEHAQNALALLVSTFTRV